MSNKFPWNEQIDEAQFWDPNSGDEVTQITTLKGRMENFGGLKIDEPFFRDLVTGIAQLMNTVEALTKRLDRLEKFLGTHGKNLATRELNGL